MDSSSKKSAGVVLSALFVGLITSSSLVASALPKVPAPGSDDPAPTAPVPDLKAKKDYTLSEAKKAGVTDMRSVKCGLKVAVWECCSGTYCCTWSLGGGGATCGGAN